MGLQVGCVELQVGGEGLQAGSKGLQAGGKGLRLHKVTDWPPRQAAPSQAEAWALAWLSAAPFASVEQPSPRGGYSAGPLPLASSFGRPLRAAAAAAAAAAVDGTREAAGVAAYARKAPQCTGT